MDAVWGSLVRFGLYVLVVGSVCGWYVYGQTAAMTRGRRFGWTLLAVVFGVGGLVLYLTFGSSE